MALNGSLYIASGYSILLPIRHEDPWGILVHHTLHLLVERSTNSLAGADTGLFYEFVYLGIGIVT